MFYWKLEIELWKLRASKCENMQIIWERFKNNMGNMKKDKKYNLEMLKSLCSESKIEIRSFIVDWGMTSNN